MAIRGKRTTVAERNHLQFAFFMKETGELFSCDEDGEQFLRSIDLDSFYAHLQCIRLNMATTSSTIILDNSSYSLRLIPVSCLSQEETHDIPIHLREGYIVILQCQPYFSSVIQKLNKVHFQPESYREIFDTYPDGIFVTRADGTALFINERYEEITGIRSETVVGKSVYTMESSGLFTPLVTPVILQTKQDYTVLQAFGTGKFAVIAGSPIYDTIGEAIMILICATPLVNPSLVKMSQRFFAPSAKQPKELYPETQIDVIAESLEMRKVIQDVIKVAQYDVPVLLLGESGTGKEVFASILHASSNRRFRPFIKVNCSAISPMLLEAELFGYEAGAFTGASSKGKAGLFETAHGGTVLLDEIGDMPSDAQAKLLRVMQNGEIYRVGGWTPIKVNTRVIASTNKDLRNMVEEGTFRNDLYYRLNVISVHLLSLTARKKDIAPLLLHYCYIFNKKYGTNKSFSPELLSLLEDYSWPGNVRELRNLVERMVILSIDDIFYPEHFYKLYESEPHSADLGDQSRSVAVKGLPLLSEAVGELEKIIVSRALARAGNTRKAAALIGVSQSTIMRKIREYRLNSCNGSDPGVDE